MVVLPPLLILQRCLQLVTQIAHILDAYGQPDQAIANTKPLAIGGRHRGMGHDGRVLDQAFDAT